MKILITGAAGFIGFSLIRTLMAQDKDVEIVGVDNINDYYTPRLKYRRLEELGIHASDEPVWKSTIYNKVKFVKMDIAERDRLERLFREEQFTHVVNLGGQAGVRYSIENPYAYVESNLVGFVNILENCRNYHVEHLLYASSSSVYGMNAKVPYAESDRTDEQVSLYAATKKSDELMAHAYSHLFGFATTGLRFFTVYGPWGRPDMAPIKFMKAIMNGDEIHVFNHGNLSRDFTYIDDIVEGVVRILLSPLPEKNAYRIYNIGCGHPMKLMDFISTIEQTVGKKANMIMEPMQPGDVLTTYCDTTKLEHDFGYKAHTSLAEGIARLYDWYKDFEH